MTGTSIAQWFKKDSLPFWTLVIVALVELLLCIQYHQRRWEHVISRRAFSKEHVGEGLVIQWNGLGYYAWLRSLLIDGDWDFDNEFDEHNQFGQYVPPPQFRTPLGRRANQWSVGPACIWAVTVVPVHFLLRTPDGSGEPWASDGYSLPYQLCVGATSLLVALLGLFFLYRICRNQARCSRAALAAALLTLGTSIVYFNAIEIASQGAGFSSASWLERRRSCAGSWSRSPCFPSRKASWPTGATDGPRPWRAWPASG
jgi:hypothetical protein